MANLVAVKGGSGSRRHSQGSSQSKRGKVSGEKIEEMKGIE